MAHERLNRDYDDHGLDPEARRDDAETLPHHQSVTSRFSPKQRKPMRELGRAMPPDVGRLSITGLEIGDRSVLLSSAPDAPPVGYSRDEEPEPTGTPELVTDYDRTLTRASVTGAPTGRPRKYDDTVLVERAGAAIRRRMWATFAKPDRVSSQHWSWARIWFVEARSYREIAEFDAGGQKVRQSYVDRVRQAVGRVRAVMKADGIDLNPRKI
jgi:hypothetical protein